MEITKGENMEVEFVPPYLQPEKPKNFWEILDECVTYFPAFDNPRKMVRQRFERNYESIKFHDKKSR